MIFWETCAIVFVLLLLAAGIIALFTSLHRALRITIPYYRMHREKYFRIVDSKREASKLHHPSYVKPEEDWVPFDSLSVDPDAEEDEFS